jgi:hypothetical protein
VHQGENPARLISPVVTRKSTSLLNDSFGLRCIGASGTGI